MKKTVDVITLVPPSSLDGGKKVTCKQAARLLHEGKAWRAYFRPDGVLSHTSNKDADNDVALVWLK